MTWRRFASPFAVVNPFVIMCCDVLCATRISLDGGKKKKSKSASSVCAGQLETPPNVVALMSV